MDTPRAPDRLVCLLVSLLPAMAVAQELTVDPCAQSHLAYAKCVGKSLEAANAEVDRAYQSALAELPESDPNDTRKGRNQLRRAQEAWRNYVTEQCAFVGGVQGGSNLWVTTFAGECELKETAKRLEFFRNPPRGG